MYTELENITREVLTEKTIDFVVKIINKNSGFWYGSENNEQFYTVRKPNKKDLTKPFFNDIFKEYKTNFYIGELMDYILSEDGQPLEEFQRFIILKEDAIRLS